MELPNVNAYSPVAQPFPSDVSMQPNVNPITNQIAPDAVNLMACTMNLKSNSQFVICPYCKQMTVTRTEKTMSFKNVLMCLCFGGIGWAGVQIFRQKDLSCFDAKHYCMKCNALLANYTAC